jgi:hypothetical protein
VPHASKGNAWGINHAGQIVGSYQDSNGILMSPTRNGMPMWPEFVVQFRVGPAAPR